MAFDQTRYERDVLKPMRGRLTDVDLVRLYAIEPDLSPHDLDAHLRNLRRFWSQRSGGLDHVATVCKQLVARDEELRASAGPALLNPQWWRDKAGERAQAVQAEVGRLAEDLRRAYGAAGTLSRSQLDAIAATWPSLDKSSVDDAVRRAGLTVVQTVPLPVTSGLDRTLYRELGRMLGEIGAPTVAHLLYPNRTQPFSLVRETGGDPPLTRDIVERGLAQAEAAADSRTSTARKSALSLVRRALDQGADLRTIALFQIVEQVNDARARGLPDSLLVRTATDLGLAQADAELLVLSLPASAAPVGDVERIRNLVEEGSLRSAERALAALPASAPHRDELRVLVAEAVAMLDELLRNASRAAASGREHEAEQQLRQAARIASDDESVTVALDRLRLQPPGELVATADGLGVRLTWPAATTAASDVRYRVTRREDRPPTSPTDGTRVADTPALECLDSAPPPARSLHYAIFATANDDVWSRPASAAITVVPAVTDVKVTAEPHEVRASWRAHQGVHAVRVRRSTGSPPRSATDGVLIASSTDHVTDRDVRDDTNYFYGIVAVYRDPGGTEVAARMVVASASPHSGPSFVEQLFVTVEAIDSHLARARISWPTAAGKRIYIRRATAAPPWASGAIVRLSDVESYGDAVVGDRQIRGADTLMEAEIPAGQHFYVAFTVGAQDQAVVGEAVTVGVTEPVRQLRARRTGDEAVLSWVWPDGVNVAEVEAAEPGQAPRIRRVTRGQYAEAGGCVIAVGPAGLTATVRTVAAGRAGHALSAPATVSLESPGGRLSYHIDRNPGLRGLIGRDRVLRVVADRDCAGVELFVIVATGPIMPLRRELGQVLEHLRGIAFHRGTPRLFPFTLPVGIRRPFWVRCFVTSPPGVTVNDPPVDEMKVSR